MSRNASAISHLMYANDILIMCRAKNDEAMTVKLCFEKYCGWSGQDINKGKSNILFS